jgi:hypothetical protein
MLIFFVGFGVGLLILTHYMPELFGTGESQSVEVEHVEELPTSF